MFKLRNSKLSFLFLLCIILLFNSCYNRRQVKKRRETVLTGYASYYAHQFHGRRTANGEIYNMHGISAAHKTLPFNTMVQVINLRNNKSITVRINDRGPFIKGRDIDLSLGAAKKIDMVSDGIVPVKMIIQGGNGLPSSYGRYAIQIGSFREEQNAVNLLNKFKSGGYSGYIEMYADFHRVRIGPYEGLDKAEREERKICRQGYDTFIVSYDR